MNTPNPPTPMPDVMSAEEFADYLCLFNKGNTTDKIKSRDEAIRQAERDKVLEEVAYTLDNYDGNGLIDIRIRKQIADEIRELKSLTNFDSASAQHPAGEEA